jgi:hypothetical protein
MEGSANLRSNGNQEQLALFTDPELHDFHAAWIDALLAKHETEEAPAGVIQSGPLADFSRRTGAASRA